MTYITPAEFEDRMRELKESHSYINEVTGKKNEDPEMFHIDADKLMIEVLNSLGYEKGCEIFSSAEKWYS